MMLAAPPRAKPGALEPRIAIAIAAAVRDNFGDFFMSSILVWRHLVVPKLPYAERACPLHRPSGKSVMPGLTAPE